MVSGSKLKCPISPSIKKCLGEASFSLYYSVICGNCLGNVLVGMKNVEKCVKCAGHSFVYTTPGDSFHGVISTLDCLSPFQNPSKSLQQQHTRLLGDSAGAEDERFRWRDSASRTATPTWK